MNTNKNTSETETPKARMIAQIARAGGHNGWAFRSCGSFDYYMATDPRSGLREAVHVAIDGSIRYSDSVRFGQFWSLGCAA